jgi:type I restriction enzyme S subunit
LPPSAEQERIATKLGTALLALQRAEMAAIRARERLHRYRNAVLSAAVFGKITAEWREAQRKNKKANIETGDRLLQGLLIARRIHWEEDEFKRLRDSGKRPKGDNWKSRYPLPKAPITMGLPELPTAWIWVSVEQVSTRVTVGYVGAMKDEYVRKGIPFLRSQNVRPNRFEPKGLVFIRPEFHKRLAKSKLTPGDVVVVRSGDVGTTCVIPETLRRANCSDLVIIQGPLVQAHFISFYMNSAAQRQIEMGKVGIAQPHFNTASVASLPIPLAPVEEQAEIVREVDRRLSAADRLSTTLEQQLARTHKTRQSLIREAMIGQLVPRDPNDEPASVLLERIGTAREAEIRRLKGKRMSKLTTRGKKLGRRSLLTVLAENGKPMTPENLFQASGHSQESVDEFFAELRKLTAPPSKVVEERKGASRIFLRAIS